MQRRRLRIQGRDARGLADRAAGLRAATAEADDRTGRHRGLRLRVQLQHALCVPAGDAVQADRVAIVPVLVVSFVAQNELISGIASVGLKG